MTKRGQITLFIIIGIILLVMIGLVLFTEKEVKVKDVPIPADIKPVKLYVENCIQSVGPFGLYLIGMQGGFIEPSPIAIRTHYSEIAYAYYEGVEILISLPRIGSQFSKYIENQLPTCINNFEAFKEFDITAGEIKANTIFTEKDTIVNVKYPLTIKKGDSITELSDFSATFPIRLKKIYNDVRTIVDKELDNPEQIDITYLQETGMDSAILPINEDTIVYILVDNESRLENVPYTFMFANKFKLEDIGGIITEHAPVLEPIADFSSTVDEEFSYKLKATDEDNDELTFFAYSFLDVAVEDDLLRFTPTEDDIGVNFIKIDVEDTTGLTDSLIVKVTVSEK